MGHEAYDVLAEASKVAASAETREIVVSTTPMLAHFLYVLVDTELKRDLPVKERTIFEGLKPRVKALDFQEGLDISIGDSEIDTIATAWMGSIAAGASQEERSAFEELNMKFTAGGGKTSEAFQEYVERFTPGAM